MSTPRLTPVMLAAGVAAARTIIEDYSKYASKMVSDDELTTMVLTIGLAMLSAQEPANDSQ